MSNFSPEKSIDELRAIYRHRFEATKEYRKRVWRVLVDKIFQRKIPESSAVLDLGCGYGEFINQVQAGEKWAMDLNPDSSEYLNGDVRFIRQDCSQKWPLQDDSLDLIFTSNFLEHLPSKGHLEMTMAEAYRCLKPEGAIWCMGPNVGVVQGNYWDFWDHHIPLTEKSLAEMLEVQGFFVEQALRKFMPYTMVGGLFYPLWMVELYLSVPLVWRWGGAQFLVRAIKR